MTLFRGRSDYNDVGVYDNLSCAFAGFSQTLVGEAFYELAYTSIIWKRSWAPVWYFLTFHFIIAFLLADLFFGMLLDGSKAADVMLEDYGDEDDQDDDNINHDDGGAPRGPDAFAGADYHHHYAANQAHISYGPAH